MRRLMPWVLGAVLGFAVGVGGTVAAQTLNDDERSRPCTIATEWANEGIIRVKEAPDDDDFDWDQFFNRTDKLLDIQYKLCHQ